MVAGQDVSKYKTWNEENDKSKLFIYDPEVRSFELLYEDPTYEDVLKNRRIQSESFLSVLKNIGLSEEQKKDKDDLINHTETVKVVYDTSKVSTEDLVKNFWEIHDPTQLDRQGNDVGNNYRSAIYWTNDNQKDIAIATGRAYQKLLKAKGYGEIVTEIAALEKFWPAENYHQDYLLLNPNGYCPDHSTGVKFTQIAASTEFGEEISPLGGKEIIVIGPEIEGTCLFCIEFERKVTSVKFDCPSLELKSLKAETQNSLTRMIPPIRPINTLDNSSVKEIIKKVIKILSAIGSKIAPNLEEWLYFLAK